MKRILPLLLSVLLILPCLMPLAASAESTGQILILEDDTIVYEKTLNADGTTYTATISDPTGDGVIPNMSNYYTTAPWLDADVSTIVFDESITRIGTFTIVLLNKNIVKDIYVMGANVTADVNAIVDYSNAPGRQATVHAYLNFNCTLSADKFAGYSYFEGEAFTEKYAALWTLSETDAEANRETILAARDEYDTLDSKLLPQLKDEKTQLDLLGAALGLDIEVPDKDDNLLFDDDTITCVKTLKTDGVTYTVTISDPTGDGVMPNLSINSAYSTMPWLDADVTTIIFDETITSINTQTIVLLNKNKTGIDIHFKNPNLTASVNAVVDYSNNPGREAIVYMYTTATLTVGERFALRYYEASNFTEAYADLWSLDVADAFLYEATIAAALAAYDTIPEKAKAQLTTEYAKLNALGEAVGIEVPEIDESLLFNNDTVIFEKLLNDDGVTYTVIVSDPDGDGSLPSLSSIYSTMPWHANDVTTVIFDETITAISAQTVVLGNSHQITDLHFKAPYVSAPANAVVDYSNAPGKQATVHAHSTWTYALSEKFAGVSFYETQAFVEAYALLWDMNVTDAAANREIISSAIASYIAETDAVQAQLTAEKAKLDELSAALTLSGSCGDTLTYLIDDVNGVLKISGSGAMADYTSAATPWAAYNSIIKKIIVDEGVTEIGAGTFSGISTLEVASLPLSLTSIASTAFPTAAFELYGWLNHATGEFAEANANISLKLKEIRILSIGNSHTMNYTDYFKNIIGDLKGNLDTTITHERIVTGSRRLVSRDSSATAGNHFDAANGDSTHGYTYNETTDVSRYVAAFKKSWDVVIVQDYHESTQFGASFATDLQRAFDWIREDAPGAKVVWFADWVEHFNVSTWTYANSIAAVNAVSALGASAPDYIIVASTIIENARNTYFGTSMNPEGISTAMPNSYKLPILECDEAHMSYELGQYMLGTSVMYQLLENFKELLPLADGFDYFDCLKTDPVHADWKGEFVPEYRDVIKEIATHSYTSRLAETASNYTVDPTAAKNAALETVLRNVTVPKNANQTSLNLLYKSKALIEEINALGFDVAPADITVTYNEPNYTVHVACQYGYSASEGVEITGTVETAAEPSVAKIGSTTYATLADAIAAANDGDTITLTDHIVLTAGVTVDGKTLTVDLGGFTVSSSKAVFTLSGSTDFTLKNGTVYTYGSKSYILSSTASGNIAVEDATLIGFDGAAISHKATEGNIAVTLKNSTVESRSAVAVYIADPQAANGAYNTLVIDSSALSGRSAVEAKRTNVSVKSGSTLSAISNRISFKETGAYGYALVLTNSNLEATVGSVTILGGSFSGVIGTEPAQEGLTNNATIQISGGSFDRPVDPAFCAEGYSPRDNGDGTYGVTNGSPDEPDTPATPEGPSDIEIVGYQVTKDEGGSFSFRIIAGINSLGYERFGFEATVTTEDGTQTLSGTDTKAYSSIYGGETAYSIKELFDCNYACLGTIADLETASSSIKLELRAYVAVGSTKTYGKTVTLLYSGALDASGYPAFTTVTE